MLTWHVKRAAGTNPSIAAALPTDPSLFVAQQRPANNVFSSGFTVH